MTVATKHPAKFSRSVLDVCAPYVPPEHYRLVLDPFAGTGLVHDLDNDTIGVELEPEWAEMRDGTIIGDATALAFPASSFDAVVTSPTYGNRFADHHDAKDTAIRRSYTHDLGRKLHPNNSGAMQWGDAYRELHRQAWRETWRVLRRRGRFVLNVKDHVRKGTLVPVAAWHYETCLAIGFTPTKRIPVETPGLHYGSAATSARAPHEWVFVLDKIIGD